MKYEYKSIRAAARGLAILVALIALLVIPLVAFAQTADSSDAGAEGDKAQELAAKAYEEAQSQIRAQAQQLEEMARQLQQRRGGERDERRRAQELQEIARQLKAQQQSLVEQQRSFELQRQAYEQAVAEMAKAQAIEGAADDPNAALKQVHQQLMVARSKLAKMEMDAGRQRAKKPPLPENAQTRVFALRYSSAPELSQVLAQIVGDRALRMGVDHRSNSLIVSSDENTMNVVEALLMKLDESNRETRTQGAAETLQLRIVWLLDGVEGKEPAAGIDTGGQESEGLVSPQVVDALHVLGFEAPKVVCQQVSTLTLGPDDERGEFRFEVPVLINSQRWQFQGTGDIKLMANERFNLRFELGFQESGDRLGGRGRANSLQGQLSGSIYTPLGHYTVMGTTTFVEPLEINADGLIGRPPQQHLSAFVVYLDRAPEFPASGPPVK